METLPEVRPLNPLKGKRRKQAEQLYYAGIFVTDIVESLHIDISDLGREVFGPDGSGNHPECWAYKKLHRPLSSPITYEVVKPVLLKKVEFQIFNRVRASIDDMEQRDELLDMDEMNKAVSMIEKLDKITRLEEGKPTQHIESEHRTYTLREIIDRRRTSEPIQEIIEVPKEAFTRVPSATPSDPPRSRERDSPPPTNQAEGTTPSVPPDSDGGTRNQGDQRPPPQPTHRRVHNVTKSRPFPPLR